jgi:hypothetical protein
MPSDLDADGTLPASAALQRRAYSPTRHVGFRCVQKSSLKLYAGWPCLAEYSPDKSDTAVSVITWRILRVLI